MRLVDGFTVVSPDQNSNYQLENAELFCELFLWGFLCGPVSRRPTVNSLVLYSFATNWPD
jgi:hypothetical protein